MKYLTISMLNLLVTNTRTKKFPKNLNFNCLNLIADLNDFIFKRFMNMKRIFFLYDNQKTYVGIIDKIKIRRHVSQYIFKDCNLNYFFV